MSYVDFNLRLYYIEKSATALHFWKTEYEIDNLSTKLKSANKRNKLFI